MNLPDKRYTESEIERAKTTSQVKGWVQGGGAVIAGLVLLKFLGWIPVLIVVAGVAWVLWKLFASPGKAKDEEDQKAP